MHPVGKKRKGRHVRADDGGGDVFCGAECQPLCLGGLDGDPIAISIVRLVRDRLIAGRAVHGAWEADDERSFRFEALEEFFDGMIYAGREMLRLAGHEQPRSA